MTYFPQKKNYLLLEDERPTRTFLNIESSKQGYSEITRLRIKNPSFDENKQEDATNIPFFEITNSKQINIELHTTFQDIYKHQQNLDTSQNALKDFLCTDNDTKPMEELENRKITKLLVRHHGRNAHNR